MTKYTLIFALSLILPNITRAQSLTEEERKEEEWKYARTIFDLITENRIQAFDTSLKPIPLQNFADQYSIYDTAVNDMWTRPAFIDNIYHPSFDGVAVQRGYPYLDTITYTPSPEYVAFRKHLYNANGSFIKIETAFLTKRNAKTLTPSQVKEKVLNEFKSKPVEKEIVSLLATNKDEYWANDEIQISGSKYLLDSCQLIYRLELKPNFELRQNYGGDTLCFSCATAQMEPEVEVGIEGDDRFFNYYERLQNCMIWNETGFWTANSKELILFDIYGVEVLRFEILSATKDFLELKKDDYKVILKKVTLN